MNIGGGGGGGGGAKFRTLWVGGGWRRGEGKLFAGCKLVRARQIITFPTLKTDNVAKLRIELKILILEIPSNEIKGTYIK